MHYLNPTQRQDMRISDGSMSMKPSSFSAIPFPGASVGTQAIREHTGALALASLGAASQSNNFKKRTKRKLDEYEADSKPPPATHVVACVTPHAGKSTAWTWPSLAFSPSLNPLEIRVNMGSFKGTNNRECHVTVAKSVGDVVPKNAECWEEPMVVESAPIDCDGDDPMSTQDDTHVDPCSLSQSQSQSQDLSQNFDWPFLASQTSSFTLEELTDSESLSQSCMPYPYTGYGL